MDEYVISDKGRQNWLVAIVAASIFMFTFDYSMVNISLPNIAGYFNATLASVARLPSAYMLVVTGLLLGFGRLGDVKGYKKIFIAGGIMFMTGTFLCGMSTSINMLLVSRMIQSTGEAMFSPTGIALITTFLPSNMKGKALGIAAMTQGLGFTLGSLIGGLINAHFGWRPIFFINIPLAVVTIILALKLLPDKQEKPAETRFDIIGAVLMFVTLATLVYALNSLSRAGVKGSVTLVCLGVSAVGFALFMIRERKVKYPIMDFELLKNRDFVFANLAAFFVVFILIGLMFLVPFYLEMVRGVKEASVGMFLMIPSFLMLVLAPFSGKLSDSFGSRKLCSIGAGLLGLSLAIISLVGPNSGLLLIAISLTILGTAAGIFMAPNNRLIMVHAPIDKQGVASGLYKISLSIGSILGISIFPIVIMQKISSYINANHIPMSEVRHSPDIMQLGFHNAFLFALVLCVLSLIFSVLARDKKG